ncbi:MAG TPA: type II toxin-antitoxin system VapC family toxin [Anaerolineae bacterium]
MPVLTICADASLALKLVLPEPDSRLARALWNEWREQRLTIVAPSLWAYETISVIRNRAHRGLLSPDLEEAALDVLQRLPVQLHRPDNLHRRAWELARRFNRPAVYDMHYVALAEMLGCPFWTAGERLFNTIQAEVSQVHWLGHYSPLP